MCSGRFCIDFRGFWSPGAVGPIGAVGPAPSPQPPYQPQAGLIGITGYYKILLDIARYY